VRRQLNLDAGKMQQLQRVDQKYEQQRRQVLKSEREARLNLKTAMQDSTGHPDQDKIAQYMDQLVHGQRQRADLLEGEQKELAGFLSPLQRAQYFALKERVTRKLMELRTDSAAGRGGQPRTPPPAP
jgi:periplasmic protein CpxP/Spy